MINMMRGRLAKGMLLMALGATFSAQGLSSDSRQPLHLWSDSAKINNNTGVAVYSGHVKVTQGSMELTGNTVTVYTENKKIIKVVSEGNKQQAFFTEEQDNNEGPVSSWANVITYDVKNQKITLKGSAKVIRHNQTFNGDYILYNKRLETVMAHGNRGDRQVQLVIQPEHKDASSQKSVNGAVKK